MDRIHSRKRAFSDASRAFSAATRASSALARDVALAGLKLLAECGHSRGQVFSRSHGGAVTLEKSRVSTGRTPALPRAYLFS